MVIDLIGASQPRELQHKEDLVWGGGIVTRYVIPLIPWPLTSFGVVSLTFAGGRRVFPSPPVFIIQAGISGAQRR